MMQKAIKRIYMSIVFLFLYAPIIVLIVFSFNKSKSRGQWGGFTFDWYIDLLRTGRFVKHSISQYLLL